MICPKCKRETEWASPDIKVCLLCGAKMEPNPKPTLAYAIIAIVICGTGMCLSYFWKNNIRNAPEDEVHVITSNVLGDSYWVNNQYYVKLFSEVEEYPIKGRIKAHTHTVNGVEQLCLDSDRNGSAIQVRFKDGHLGEVELTYDFEYFDYNELSRHSATALHDHQSLLRRATTPIRARVMKIINNELTRDVRDNKSKYIKLIQAVLDPSYVNGTPVRITNVKVVDIKIAKK